MMNREAFDEGYGVAGWWLQRLGAFSVERGGLHNEEAKRYAIEVVMRGREVLVIFPEGEIYYLNDLVQPFKSGAVDIGMQAVVEARRTRPDWTAYLVPMALKYRYREPIAPILERRTRLMEQRLNRRIARSFAPAEVGPDHGGPAPSSGAGPSPEARPPTDSPSWASACRRSARPSSRRPRRGTPGPPSTPAAQTMDRAWRLSSYLRDLLARRGRSGGEDREQVRTDLASSESVAQMGGWQPQYTDVDPSQERLAEMVLKLEREVYRTKRPRQLAKRDLFLRIGEPIDLSRFVPDYLQDARAVRHRVAEQLRDRIQALIDTIAILTHDERMGAGSSLKMGRDRESAQ